jgi:ArsR family transcriptional regulator
MSKRSYETKDERIATCDADIVDHAAVSSVRSKLPAVGDLGAGAAIFDALSDPTRLRILLALAERELCVCDLAAIAGISQSGVSHQLRLLRALDLVTFRREGKRAVYRLADDHVGTLLAQGLEHARERSGGASR